MIPNALQYIVRNKLVFDILEMNGMDENYPV